MRLLLALLLLGCQPPPCGEHLVLGSGEYERAWTCTCPVCGRELKGVEDGD